MIVVFFPTSYPEASGSAGWFIKKLFNPNPKWEYLGMIYLIGMIYLK